MALRHGHLLRPWARCRRLSNAAAEELAAQVSMTSSHITVFELYL